MAITPPDYPGGNAHYHWRKRTNEMEQALHHSVRIW